MWLSGRTQGSAGEKRAHGGATLAWLRCGAWIVAVSAVGCGSAGTGTSEQASEVGSGKATTSCAKETRAQTYTAGIAQTTVGGYRVRILEANPAPIAKGLNHWVVEVVDGSGAPVDAALSVRPYMPDHGHGSDVEPLVESEATGRYSVERISVVMPGYWTFDVSVTTASGTEEAEFRFCVDG